MDYRMFEVQKTLVAREYRVLLWDVHGHGQSRPLGMGGVFSLRTVIDDLLAIIDQLGYQQACFVGLSFGTLITQELAFLYPERVTALVVIGGYCLTMRIPQSLGLRRQQGEASSMSDREFKQSIANMVGIRPEVKVEDLLSEMGRFCSPCFWHHRNPPRRVPVAHMSCQGLLAPRRSSRACSPAPTRSPSTPVMQTSLPR